MQVNMKNYYIDNAMSSMRQIVARAAHKAVLCATICRTVWQNMYYLSYIYRISFVYVPYIYRSWQRNVLSKIGCVLS